MIHRLHRFLIVRVAKAAVAVCLVGGLATLPAEACSDASHRSIVSFIPVVLADDEDNQGDEGRHRGEARVTVSGLIDSVDYASNAIHVISPAGRIKILLTPTTAIALRGQVGGISDLRHGLRITASGIVQNGVMTALSIIIR